MSLCIKASPQDRQQRNPSNVRTSGWEHTGIGSRFKRFRYVGVIPSVSASATPIWQMEELTQDGSARWRRGGQVWLSNFPNRFRPHVITGCIRDGASTKDQVCIKG